MAYIKYKELTKYFNFNEEIDINNLPSYVTDYMSSNEKILYAYKTKKDKAIFTDKSMILFDVSYLLGLNKKIHVIPYKSISSTALIYRKTSGSIFISLDSGYQLRLDFIKLLPKEKTRLRLLYSSIMEKVKNSN